MQQVPISEVGKKEQERPIWFVPPKSLIDFFHLSRFPELCEFFLENETCSVHTSPAIKKKKKACTNGRLCIYCFFQVIYKFNRNIPTWNIAELQ